MDDFEEENTEKEFFWYFTEFRLDINLNNFNESCAQL